MISGHTITLTYSRHLNFSPEQSGQSKVTSDLYQIQLSDAQTAYHGTTSACTDEQYYEQFMSNKAEFKNKFYTWNLF